MFNLRQAVRTIKRQGELIHQYQEEHEILIKENRILKEQNEILKEDLFLATKKKVEYRNLLQKAGIKIKSMLSVGKHASTL